jgi:hypothetical protein
MLASIRHFLKFVDLDQKFDKYGFQKKVSYTFQGRCLELSQRSDWCRFQT